MAKEILPELILDDLSETESKPTGQLAPCVVHVFALKLLSHGLPRRPPLKVHLMWWRPSRSEKVTVCLGNGAKTTAGAKWSSTRESGHKEVLRGVFLFPEKQNHKQRTLALLKWPKDLRRVLAFGEMVAYSKFRRVSSENSSVSLRVDAIHSLKATCCPGRSNKIKFQKNYFSTK